MTFLPTQNSRNRFPRNPRTPRETSSVSVTSNSVKVLYIISDLSIGGAEMMLYKLLAETNRERYSPVVLSLIDRGPLRERIEALGIPVHTAQMKAGQPSLSGLWRLVKLARRLKPDLILGWMYHSCLAAEIGRLFSGLRTPVLWSIHYSVGSLATEKRLTAAVIKLCGLLSRLPAKVIYVSHVSQARHQLLRYRLKNSCVIPNGIDVNKFVPSTAARLVLRDELRISPDAFLIGLTGRYHPMKDHYNFLRAAALLLEKHPKTHFVLIGAGVDNSNHRLRNSTVELGLGDRIHWLGERQDTARLAAALDIFSLSSAYGESCPNVIGEAMACGVPCVVTAVGDAAWIVGETGRVVPPRDAGALAAAWKEMIELSSQSRAALGLRARARVIENFPIKSVVARYEALYETALARKLREEFVLSSPARISAFEPAFEESIGTKL